MCDAACAESAACQYDLSDCDEGEDSYSSDAVPAPTQDPAAGEFCLRSSSFGTVYTLIVFDQSYIGARVMETRSVRYRIFPAGL